MGEREEEEKKEEGRKISNKLGIITPILSYLILVFIKELNYYEKLKF